MSMLSEKGPAEHVAMLASSFQAEATGDMKAWITTKTPPIASRESAGPEQRRGRNDLGRQG
jgi:hypothetical protein